MKNKILRFFPIMGIAAAMILTSCGESLLDNLDPNQQIGGNEDGLNQATMENVGGLFLTAQQKLHDIGKNSGPHVYQVQCNIHIDNYAGYLAGTQNFNGNLPSTYAYFPEYHNSPKYSFFNVSNATMPIIRSAKKLNLEEIGAMSEIMYCFSALEMTDIYGPMPWYDYRMDKQEPPLTFEPVKDVYDSIFVHLKEANEVLLAYKQKTKEHQDSIAALLAEYDRLCAGDVDKWRRFGNSIRLRMAVRMSNVDPERAKAEAKLAIEDGLIKSTVAYNLNQESLTNPIMFISQSWNDTRLNASMENIMKRLKFPFMKSWFQVTDNIKDKTGKVVQPGGQEIIGVRTGIPTTARDGANQYVQFSKVHTSFAQKPIYLFKYSEALFLEAEAELRWEVGTLFLKKLYENGIQEMFKDENVAASSDEYRNYYNQEKADESVNYVDPHYNAYNLDGLLTVGVKWNNADSDQEKLEKIITQKWLANFPMGLEAWNDLRRTGYPRIFPVQDIGDGSLSSGSLIRRIPWDMSDASTMEDIMSSGIPALGGANEEATRLWWDCVDPNGFSRDFDESK